MNASADQSFYGNVAPVVQHRGGQTFHTKGHVRKDFEAEGLSSLATTAIEMDRLQEL